MPATRKRSPASEDSAPSRPNKRRKAKAGKAGLPNAAAASHAALMRIQDESRRGLNAIALSIGDGRLKLLPPTNPAGVLPPAALRFPDTVDSFLVHEKATMPVLRREYARVNGLLNFYACIDQSTNTPFAAPWPQLPALLAAAQFELMARWRYFKMAIC